MANGIPKWADPITSAKLPGIRSAGEGATVEFKERFPDQAHRLAQELAAFGTSGRGDVFIGINDNGDLVGVNARDGDARDDLIERAQGVVNTIRPKLSVEILFSVENEIPVIIIRVPPQDEPVFYYEHRPYIRDGRRSRPATPDEVKAHVWGHPSAEHARALEKLKFCQVQAEAVSDLLRRQGEAMAESDQHQMELLEKFQRRLGSS